VVLGQGGRDERAPEHDRDALRSDDQAAVSAAARTAGSALRFWGESAAPREGIVGEADGLLKLRVTAPPVEGRANEACLRLLAGALDLPISRLRIVSGQHARLKKIQIATASAQTIRAQLFDLRERPRR